MIQRRNTQAHSMASINLFIVDIHGMSNNATYLYQCSKTGSVLHFLEPSGESMCSPQRCNHVQVLALQAPEAPAEHSMLGELTSCGSPRVLS